MNDPFARFTESARRTCELALREALVLGHNYVGTEHLLLSLARQEDALAFKVLANLGVTPEAVRREVLRQLPPRRESGPKLAELLRKAADALDTDATTNTTRG